MKVQDFAYQVSARTMELLETTQHYKISEAHRKEVLGTILKEIEVLIQKASAKPKTGKH